MNEPRQLTLGEELAAVDAPAPRPDDVDREPTGDVVRDLERAKRRLKAGAR